jgi:hypothetical protein
MSSSLEISKPKRLTMMAEMSLWDINGRCRCPHCGKFRKRSDIPNDQSTAMRTEGEVVAIIHLAPACFRCLDPVHEARDE